MTNCFHVYGYVIVHCYSLAVCYQLFYC